jgi:hypothetical protein
LDDLLRNFKKWVGVFKKKLSLKKVKKNPKRIGENFSNAFFKPIFFLVKNKKFYYLIFFISFESKNSNKLVNYFKYLVKIKKFLNEGNKYKKFSVILL